MTDAQTRPSWTVPAADSLTQIRWGVGPSEASMSSSLKEMLLARAWCQTNEMDYCPLVISVMSFVILTSFIAIVYLCAKTTLDAGYWLHWCCCCGGRVSRLVCKLVGRGDDRQPTRHQQQQQHQQQQRERFHRCSTASLYRHDGELAEPDVLSLSSIDTDTARHARPPHTAAAPSTRRSIWWIAGAFAGPHTVYGKHLVDAVGSSALVVAPPTYDESQQQHRRHDRANRSQIVRKQPKLTATENAAFCMESNVDEPTATASRSIGRAQFPAYRCLSLSMSAADTTARSTRTISQHQQTAGNSANALVVDFDRVSTLGVDEVPPPYEAVIVTNSVPPSASGGGGGGGVCATNESASLSARLANYSFRSAREFQI